MTSGDVLSLDLVGGESPSQSADARRNTALTQRITQVLSSSYADSDIREGLAILDQRKIKNTPQVRRRLRLDAEKDLIDCNGSIVKDFGQVAQVRLV